MVIEWRRRPGRLKDREKAVPRQFGGVFSSLVEGELFWLSLARPQRATAFVAEGPKRCQADFYEKSSEPRTPQMPRTSDSQKFRESGSWSGAAPVSSFSTAIARS